MPSRSLKWLSMLFFEERLIVLKIWRFFSANVGFAASNVAVVVDVVDADDVDAEVSEAVGAAATEAVVTAWTELITAVDGGEDSLSNVVLMFEI